MSWGEKSPVCANCGNFIEDDNDEIVWRFGDDLYCEWCIEDLIKNVKGYAGPVGEVIEKELEKYMRYWPEETSDGGYIGAMPERWEDLC